MSWTPGNHSGSQTLTPTDDLFADHVNELRVASDTKATLGTAETFTAVKTFNAGIFLDKGSVVFDVRAFLAVGDGKIVTDAAITSGSPTLTSATAGFVPGDVGKTVIGPYGAGVIASFGSGNMITTISAYVNATTVTLAANATHTVSGAKMAFGTNNTTPFNNAVSAALGKGTVFVPQGIYISSGTITVGSNVQIIGAERESCQIVGGAVNAYGNLQVFANITVDAFGGNFAGIDVKGQTKLFHNIHVKNAGQYSIRMPYDASFGNVGDTYVQFSFFENPDAIHNNGGLILAGSYNHIAFLDNDFGDNLNGGIAIEVVLGLQVAETDAVGLYFERNKVLGQYTSRSYFVGRHIRIRDNDFATSFQISSGTHNDSQYTTRDAIVEGNTMQADGHSGGTTDIEIYGGALGTGGSNTDSGVVEDVTIRDNNLEFARIFFQPPDALDSTYRNIKILNNTVRDTAGAGLLAYATNASITFDSLQIKGNKLVEWQSGAGSYGGLMFAGNGATHSVAFSRSSIKENIFGPPRGGATIGVYLQVLNSSTFSGTLELSGNDLTGVTVNEDQAGIIDRKFNNTAYNPIQLFAVGNSGTTKTIDRVNGDHQTVTMTGNCTFTITAGKAKGDTLTLELTQDATGSRTATWPGNFKKAGGTLTLTTAAASTDIITARFDGTSWVETSRALNVS